MKAWKAQIRVIIPLIVCILLTLGSAGSVWSMVMPSAGWKVMPLPADDAYTSLQRLNETAVALYDAAMDNNRQAGYIQLQKVIKQIDQQATSPYGRFEGWVAIRDDAIRIEAALAKGVVGSSWLYLAAQIRLAVDAAVHSERALWLQYEGLLQDGAVQVKQAWRRQAGDSSAAARAMLHSMTIHVERIDAASRMSGAGAKAAELKERIQYTDKLLASYKRHGARNAAAIDTSLQALELAVQSMFLEVRNDEHAVPAIASPATSKPISWALFLGTIISAVLTYSGWRKYKQNPFDVKRI